MESLYELKKYYGVTNENEWNKKPKEEKDILFNRFKANAAKLFVDE